LEEFREIKTKISGTRGGTRREKVKKGSTVEPQTIAYSGDLFKR